MRVSDTLLGALTLLFGLAIMAYASTLPPIPGQKYGAALFPTLIGVGFVGCAIFLIISGRGTGVPHFARTETLQHGGAISAVVVTLGCIVAYIFLADIVGFIPMSFAILTVLFLMLKVPLWQTVPLAIIATLVIDYAFRSVLLVPLPFGIVPRLPW